MKYKATIELTAYDHIAVEADSVEEAKDKVHDILRKEQEYEQRTIRPIIASIKWMSVIDEEAEIVWRRGADPLVNLLIATEQV